MLLVHSKQSEKHYPNGTKEIHFPNDTVKYIYSNGEEESVFPDGLSQRNYPNGNITLQLPNGIKEYYTAEFKVLLFLFKTGQKDDFSFFLLYSIPILSGENIRMGP
jgi:hypothetical protein